MLRRELLMATAMSTVMVGQAFADEYGTANQRQVTIQQAASMMAYSAGNDQARVSIAPNWSDELGWSVRAAAGSYLGDAVALGAIVEYGQDKQEYLANIGLQLSNSLSLIGTVGNLAETKEFIDGEGDDKASQMEYGLSLKLAPQEGLGFELNGYAVNSKASNDSIETGMLYGSEALAVLGSPDSTLVKLGGGYEWLEWDGGEKDDHWTLRSEVNQQFTDVLGLQGHAKLGASERSYGGGLNFNLSDNGTNLFGVNYTYIDGRLGIADDKRIEVSWTYGLGAGPSSKVAVANGTDQSGTINAAANAVVTTPSNDLLRNVMKRPAFLPERVLAKAATASVGSCSELELGYWITFDEIIGTNDFAFYNDIDINERIVFFFVSKETVPEPTGPGDYEALSPAAIVKLGSVVIPDTTPGVYQKVLDPNDPEIEWGQEYTFTINDGPISCQMQATAVVD